MKKKTSIIIGITVAIIISMISGGIVVSGVLDPYEKQIKLGYKMISQEKYEEAILAFNKAIEIDQKKEKAYIGLLDTYVARCDESTVNDANDALKRGYEQSQSEKIVDSYINSAQKLYDKDKKDWAIELLEKGYEITKNEKIRAKIEEFIKLISFELLDKLYKYCESDNLDEVRKIMNTEEFVKIASYATEDSPILYSPNTNKDNSNTKKLGIYISSYLYFGDYKDNIRSGDGIWLEEDKKASYTFNGKWDNDKPNGEGVEKQVNKNEVPFQESLGWEITSQFKDGFINGQVNEKITDAYGNVDVWNYSAVDGIALEDTRLEKCGGDDDYTVAAAENNKDHYRVWRHGDKYGVFGFYN